MVKVATDNKLEPKTADIRFISDIKTQYDSKTTFETSLKSLKNREKECVMRTVAAEKIGSALIADNAGLEERKKLFEQDRHNLLNSYKLEIELIGNKTLNQIQSISAIAQIRQTSCKRL